MINKKPQILFFGTSEFAVPALKSLLRANFCNVACVVTQTDKPIGRHRSKLVPCPIKKIANEEKLLVCNNFQNNNHNYDLGIIVAYGKIIPKKIIDSFPLGIVNIHPSILPKYRGPSPIQATILNQDHETGVSLIKLDEKIDHGPIIAQEKIKLNKTETSGELHNTLAKAGAKMLIKILPNYINGKINLKKQDDSKASYTKKLTKQDAKIKSKQTIDSIYSFVRAMNPWPGAWTIWKNKKLTIWSVNLDGTIKEMQLEGKKRMPYEEFKKGHPDFILNDFSLLH